MFKKPGAPWKQEADEPQRLSLGCASSNSPAAQFVGVGVCVCACACECEHACVSVSVPVCVHVCLHVTVSVCVSMRLSVCVYTCVCPERIMGIFLLISQYTNICLLTLCMSERPLQLLPLSLLFTAAPTMLGMFPPYNL